MFGSQLTQQSRDRATELAQVLVENDPSLQPENTNVNWLLIGGLFIGGIWILKRL